MNHAAFNEPRELSEQKVPVPGSASPDAIKGRRFD